MKDEILNLKDIVITKLQEDNARLTSKCSYLENRVDLLETKLKYLDQYGTRNNLELSEILNTVNDDDPENTVTSLMSDIDVTLEPRDIEDCHWIGLADKNNLKKTII